ncbi:MAG: DUF2163 domain-containing protein [Pseudomonadota bacterium]
MSAFNPDLLTHMQSGLTTTCQCWAITRQDGVELGFTDHDQSLSFEGITFRADTGLSAKALQQTTGLSVDNTEALGALIDMSITEADIEAGRYDNAQVRAWIVNWDDVTQRQLQFRGTIGEIKRMAGAFEAELRGLTDRLNMPQGRVFQRADTTLLGDDGAPFDLTSTGYFADVTPQKIAERRAFTFDALAGFQPGWFVNGTLQVRSGLGAGLAGLIKRDRMERERRVIELWQPLRADLGANPEVRLLAGFDGSADTARLKFENLANFQGFPDIPGDDWSISDPSRSGRLDGGSRRR